MHSVASCVSRASLNFLIFDSWHSFLVLSVFLRVAECDTIAVSSFFELFLVCPFLV